MYGFSYVISFTLHKDLLGAMGSNHEFIEAGLFRVLWEARGRNH